jgi:ssDNA-binding Zn-finger/Zn-ribbon topoisomerase 1
VAYKKRRMEKEKRRAEHMIKLQEQKEAELARQAEEAAKRKAALEEKQRLEEEQSQAKIKKRDEEFKRSIQSTITQQKTPVIDSEGNRWIKCEFCGKIAKDSEFAMYGGPGRVNIGTCYECIKNNPAAKPKPQEPAPKEKSILDPNTCPECGGQLRIRSGKRGKFIGCSNFPACRYTRDL